MSPFIVSGEEVAAFRQFVRDNEHASAKETATALDLIDRMLYAGYSLGQMYEFIVGDESDSEVMRLPGAE